MKKDFTEEAVAFYSKVLKEPFDRIEDLRKAEEAYYKKQRTKEEAAQKLEASFKNLSAAREACRNELKALIEQNTLSLNELKAEFEKSKSAIQGKLSAAEAEYASQLRTFTENGTATPSRGFSSISEIFDMFF